MKKLFVPLVLLLPVLGSAELFDHNSQHCHDVSTWGAVKYRDEECKKCDTKFEKQCETKTTTVCGDVPTTNCDLVPYTDCRMTMDMAEYSVTEMLPDDSYTPIECKNRTREEIHMKLVPKCIDVERLDCVTKWVLSSSGEKIWDGNEACSPVKWKNCTLVPEPKKFNQTYTECRPSGVPIPTATCRNVTRERMITGMECDVRSVVNCTTITENVCVDLTYQVCSEVPMPLDCVEDTIRRPYQPRIHRVKCLLESSDELPELSAEESAEKARERLDREGGESSLANGEQVAK